MCRAKSGRTGKEARQRAGKLGGQGGLNNLGGPSEVTSVGRTKWWAGMFQQRLAGPKGNGWFSQGLWKWQWVEVWL